MQTPSPSPGRFQPLFPRIAAGLIAIAALWVAALPVIERHFLARAAREGETTLRIAVEGLRGTLERFAPLPKLIAERPILIELLKDPGNQGLVPFVNEQLRLTAMSLGVSDVYLMDIGGTTVAASSYRKERSFVGRNFGYRPYFTQALEGGLGQFFALGTTSGKRGYFFASPVLDNTRIRGVIAIKFSVEPFEAAWRGAASEIIVTDLANVVFMSSRKEWHFRTLRPLDGASFGRIADTRQYPLERLVDLPNTLHEPAAGLRLMSIEGEEFVLNTASIADAGWNVMHLAPAGPARMQAKLVLLFAGLVLLLVALTATVIVQRFARARERAQAQRLLQEELESRVARRTADLNAANAKLRREVDERTMAERRLRKTQKELVQAGKLAALGQMSAALSHEINQPLTAVKSYADNAATFLDRGRVGEARDNIDRISRMADRMAALSGHLRNFARRPQDTVGPVDLVPVVEDAIELMGSRLRRAGATVVWHPPAGPAWVRGGRLRLQQVFVNLISNALDAMENLPEPEIRITLEKPSQSRFRVSVADRGPGLSDEALAHLFDPFFTTKDPGQGVGLGLSISFNIVEDFGGKLIAANNPDGTGATFSVELDRCRAPSRRSGMAAE